MQKVAKWIKSWEWPEEVTENVRELLLVDDKGGQTLHICCGSSTLGDVFIDADPQRADIVKADMRELPFETGTFLNTIIDPPWKLGYYQRFRPFYEAVRVTEIGGYIFYNATWIPHAENTELLNVYVRRDSHWGNVSVFSVFRKTGVDPERQRSLEIAEDPT
jgi:hypothetical protein|tara:strand:+ start:415 stop:900 length:486 start_codon:yes stop_codon:yes gene_type:complete